MADKTRYTNSGTTGDQFGSVGETWAALPSNTFPTQAVQTFGTFSATTNVWTAPASDLPDGVLVLMHLQGEDTSNGRANLCLRCVNTSGTGTIVTAQGGGYCRDTSEDRLYARSWAIIHAPGASSTWTIQGIMGTDDVATTDEFVNGSVEFIPLYYNAIGMYTSQTTQTFAGTTFTRATGWSASIESDTAAIELGATTANVVDCKTNGARYLVFGGAYFDCSSGRTQRVASLRRDSVNSAQGVMYLRQSSVGEMGTPIYDAFQGGASAIGVDMAACRGIGVAARQGGADLDGTLTTANTELALVVIELNSSAEMLQAHDGTGQQECALTGPVDLNIARTVNFNDSAAFTGASISAVNCEKAMDVLGLANINCPRNTSSIGSGNRWTASANLTLNGVEDAATQDGDYNRGNQSTTDTHGWSAHPAGYITVAANDDIGVSVTELPASEGGGGDIETEPFANNEGLSLILVNLDSLEAAGGTNITRSPANGSLALTGQAPTVVTTMPQLTGTPVEIVWAAGTDPAPQDVTVPADCDAVYIFWTYWFDGSGNGLASITLEGVSPDESVEQTTTTNLTASGVAAFYNPTTGANQTVDLSFDAAPTEGSTCIVAFVKNGDTSGWRDAQLDHDQVANAVSATVTTEVGDLVLKYDQRFNASEVVPSLSSGWTSAQIAQNNDEAARLSQIRASGASQVCDAEDENYSTIVALSIGPPVGSFTRDPGTGSCALTGQTPTVQIAVVRQPANGTLALTGQTPTMIREDNHVIGVPVGSLTITGLAPTVEVDVVRQPAIDTLVLTGRLPTMVRTENFARAPPDGSLALTGLAPKRGRGLLCTGYAPTVIAAAPQFANPGAGSLDLTGLAPSVEIDVTRRPSAGSLSLSGLAPTVEIDVARNPAAGTLNLSGQQPTVDKSANVLRDPDAGSLTLAGLAPSVEIAPVRRPDAGSISLAGLAPVLQITVVRRPDAGSLALTGAQPAVLTGNNAIPQPATGSLALTGLAPSVEEVREVAVPAGTLTLTGLQPKRGRGLLCTGHAPTVKIDATLALPPVGSLTLTGQQPTVEANITVLPGAGSLAITPQTWSSEGGVVFIPPVDPLTITGYAPSIEIMIEIAVPTGSLNVTGHAPFFDQIIVPTGAMQFFGWAPKRGQGLRLTGYVPNCFQQPIGNITEFPANAELTITTHTPTLDQEGVVTDRTPGDDNLVIQERIPAVVTDIIGDSSSLLIQGQLPSVRYNFHDPVADQLVLTGHAAQIIAPIPVAPGSMAITGHAPSITEEEGFIIVEPGAGSISLTGRRPLRFTGNSAQINMTSNVAASGGLLLFSASITITGQLAANSSGSYCTLPGKATINIFGEGEGEGAIGDLKLAFARMQINSAPSSPSLYHYSDGTALLAKASIQL